MDASDGVGADTATNDSGQCKLHASIQIKRLKRNGEWVQIMKECPLCSAFDGNPSKSSSRVTTPQTPSRFKECKEDELPSRTPTDVNNCAMRSKSVITSMTCQVASVIFPPLPLTMQATESTPISSAATISNMHSKEEIMSLQQLVLDRKEKIRQLKIRGSVRPSQRDVVFAAGNRTQTTEVSRNLASNGESATSFYTDASHHQGKLKEDNRVSSFISDASHHMGKLTNDNLQCNARPPKLLIMPNSFETSYDSFLEPTYQSMGLGRSLSVKKKRLAENTKLWETVVVEDVSSEESSSFENDDDDHCRLGGLRNEVPPGHTFLKMPDYDYSAHDPPDLTSSSNSGESDDMFSCNSHDTLAQEGLRDYQTTFDKTNDFEKRKADLPLTSMTRCTSNSLSAKNSSSSTDRKTHRSDSSSNSNERNSPRLLNSSTSMQQKSLGLPINKSSKCSDSTVSSASSVQNNPGMKNGSSISTHDSGSSQESVMSFSTCDSQGRCVYHPNIQLRRKSAFGGLMNGKWKTVMRNCTECCLEEVHRLRKNILLDMVRMDTDNTDIAVSALSSSLSDSSSGSPVIGVYSKIPRCILKKPTRTDDDSDSSSSSTKSGSTVTSLSILSSLHSSASHLTAGSSAPLPAGSSDRSQYPGILRRPAACGSHLTLESKRRQGSWGRVVFSGRDDIINC